MLQDYEKDFYTIAEVAMFTGLTDRCIRSHIAKGYLHGEKVDGAWRFSGEQVGDYFLRPEIKAGMAARKNGVVYDFLQDTFKKTPQACFILDIPDLAQADPAAAFFLKEMNSGNYKGIRYAFDNLNGIPRVILTGDADAVLRMASAYHAQASSQENEHLPAF